MTTLKTKEILKKTSIRFEESEPCVKGDHLVLTSRGWIEVQNLEDDDEILSINKAI